MCNQGLLKKLVAFLEYSERVPDDEDHWKIRLSVVWAVLNLSWREETTGSDLDNDDDDSAEDMDVDAGDGARGWPSSTSCCTKTRTRAEFRSCMRAVSGLFIAFAAKLGPFSTHCAWLQNSFEVRIRNAGSGAKKKNLAGLPNRGLKGRRLNISDVSYFETGLADQTI
ncbi:hypothetical protein KL928_005011 [Ogataea angusta]|uniref:Uncharacterized protein n=1 Tax=Pichia angusta TaxID=870730 RepID=A0AAN6DAT6_PICAN|nr:uncharacterized protein KL928_005011 [Ogataea angusta]KAG7816045.1 hypothetical protein KL928_005011 [Ogataea angusta]